MIFLKKRKKPFVLAILDGWGVGEENKKTNAIFSAKTPFFDYACQKYGMTTLDASGEAVGLEKNQMSGSETGHLNIGAGRVVKQEVRVILEEISRGAFFGNPFLLNFFRHIKNNNANVHLMGMLGNSDSPHSHPDIFLALLIFLKKQNLGNKKVFIHLFTDGRDSFPQSALTHWSHWKNFLEKNQIGNLATVCGRFWAMDRTRNWDRLLRTYKLLVFGKGEKFPSFEKVIEHNYSQENTDEYIEPSVIENKDFSYPGIKPGDGIIFFNLRSDRARQLSKLFVGIGNEKEPGFPVIQKIENLKFLGLTDFGPDLNLQTLYPSRPLSFTLLEVLSEKKQLYISETEKYAHITYFLNGGYAEPVAGEERIIIPSPKVRSYDQAPKMSAEGITEIILKNLQFKIHDFTAVNFANADMVGHTGNFEATKMAVETVDDCLKKIYQQIKKEKGILFITADHGNADIMLDEASGQLFTFHTKNPVPFLALGETEGIKWREGGKLADVTPTLLDFFDLEKPEEMTGASLREK